MSCARITVLFSTLYNKIIQYSPFSLSIFNLNLRLINLEMYKDLRTWYFAAVLNIKSEDTRKEIRWIVIKWAGTSIQPTDWNLPSAMRLGLLTSLIPRNLHAENKKMLDLMFVYVFPFWHYGQKRSNMCNMTAQKAWIIKPSLGAHTDKERGKMIPKWSNYQYLFGIFFLRKNKTF